MKKLIFWAFSIFFAAFVLLVPQPVHAAPPTNFQKTLIVGTGLDGPSGFEIAPDGRIFIIQRTGEIKIYKNGNLLPQNFAVLPSEASGDRGMIGITFDPNFLTNHWVYIYYTASADLKNYLVRFDASTDVAQSGPTILYQTNDQSFWLHVGGTIRFGTDGKLYLSIGDNGYPPNAQNLGNPHGKILRLNKDGSVPGDNPFVGVPGALPEIYAYGLRNPFRFNFDSATGKMYEGDVGEATWEEINYIQPGKNYGWPNCESPCNPTNPKYTDPIYWWPHNGGSAASVGGPVYHGQMFPAAYQGTLFFGDYAQGWIKTMTLGANGTNQGVQAFDDNAGSVVEMRVDPRDDSLYYITYYPGALYRITYSTGTQVPTANASSDVTKGVDPLTVQFSSAGSNDPQGLPLTYDWDFGDGSAHSTQANPTKVFPTKGRYIVYLRVSNGTYTALANPIVIQVGLPPKVTIGLPKDGDMYNAGDQITVNVSGVDGVGNDISDASLKTTIVFHHQTHIHPFLGPLTGRSHTFTIPTTGESSAETWYEIDATATDTNGLQSTDVVQIYPHKVNLSFSTVASGLQVLLDGIPTNTPATIQSVVGFMRELSAPFVQTVNGAVYQLDRWSDGGSWKHIITTPNIDAAFTAFFNQVPPFKGEYFNNVTLSGTPVLTRNDASVDFTWNEAAPDPAVPADKFSVRWSKTQHFTAGTYKFTTETDDGVRLYIDNNLVIDQWHDQRTIAYNAMVTLSNADHAIRMEYYDNGGGAIARLYWDITDGSTTTPTPTPTPPAGSVYSYEYFDNMTLSGGAKATGTVGAIDFDWGAGSPAQLIPADQFSARWTKTETFAAGTYRFTTTSDDGIRVYLDGILILDKWIDQAPTTYTIDKDVTAGDHTLKVEYYENSGGAVAKFNFVALTNPTPTPTPTPSTTYLGQYWNTPGAGAQPVIPVTAPDLTRNDNTIDFDWGGSSPAVSINNDHFVARWTKTDTFAAGRYTFTATADDGIRVYVDGVAIIDKWIDQPSTTYTAQTDIAAGNHEIKVEYYENGGGAAVKVVYVQVGAPNPTPTPTETPTPTPPPSSSYDAKYWNTPGAGAKPAIPASAPTLTRVDAKIDFDWGGGSPDATVTNDHFVAVWTKTDAFEAATYKFTATADDGIRLYVDNQLILDKWIDQPATTYTVNKDLTAGNHDVKIEYYENGGGAVAKVDYVKGAGGAPASTPTPTPIGTPQKLGRMDLQTYCVGKGQSGSDLVNNTWVCSPSGTAIDMNDACKVQYSEPASYAQQDVAGNPYTWSCYK